MAEVRVRAGEARSPGFCVPEVLRREAESEAVPPVLLEESYRYLGSEDLSIDRYISGEYHRAEIERMWSRVWQMACRVEEVAAAGDRVVYEIGDTSIVIVRGRDGELRGFYNSCLHRGTRLCPSNGTAPVLACRYHGWTWNLDGSLKLIPAAWDFAHVDAEAFGLPQCRVDVWNGFVFVCMNPETPPLLEYLEVLPEHFAYWDYTNADKIAHVSTIVHANWKVAAESGMEGYHAVATHPQLAPVYDFENTQCDVWGRHVSRTIAPMGIPAPALREMLGEQEIANALAHLMGGAPLDVPEGRTARHVAAAAAREQLTAYLGIDHTSTSTTEVVDFTQYFVFPNILIGAGHGFPFVFRWRPHGASANEATVEIMLFRRREPGTLPAPPVPVKHLPRPDWSLAPELSVLGQDPNQDIDNLPEIQAGLRTSARGRVTLGDYQEIAIRHFHQTLESYLARS